MGIQLKLLQAGSSAPRFGCENKKKKHPKAPPVVKPSVLPWGEEVGKPSELKKKTAKKKTQKPKAALGLHSSK